MPASAISGMAVRRGVAPSVPVLGAKTDEVTARLEAIRAEIKFPALGAALVTADEVEGVWVTGTRRAGGEELVEETDRWHLGSCKKPMTATLIALLVALGDLAWDTPLEVCCSRTSRRTCTPTFAT